MRQKAAPIDHLLFAMASDINDGIKSIPSDKIYECWMVAKSESDFMPLDGSLNRAWKEKVDKRTHIPNSAIEYKPRHSCRYCIVVALRMGISIHDASEWEIEAYKGDITIGEINCILTSKPDIIEFHNTHKRSPYQGVL
jgi:hypothetical protein